MGLRFRRSVKIMPGVKVNLSASGTSLTVGPKGFTTTIGKGGRYRNVGIPGTGISARYKVGGKKRRKKGAATTKRRKATASKATSKGPAIPAAIKEWMAYTGESNPTVSIEQSYEGEISLYDANDRLITDQQLIGIIKRTPIYKEQLPALKEQHRAEVLEKVEELNAENDEFIKIYQYSPQVLGLDYYQEALDGLVPEHYEPVPFLTPQPTLETIRALLYSDAERDVKAPFWKRNRLRTEYVDAHFVDRFDSEMKRWEAERDKHELAEQIKANQLNADYQEEYEELKKAYTLALEGDPFYIEAAAEEWISEVDIPVEISTQFEYRAQDHCLMVDLDLPEIEDLPTTVATQLANGDLKIKDKTQKQLRFDYAECVFGIAIYVAANLLNTSPAVTTVTVSGYTQRRNRAGDINDDYIYSIKLPRIAFDHIDYENMDPEVFCLGLENRCNISTTKVFKVIEPFE
ncbi:MAG: DUF4236 domain-containing protein [Atopobiaceae bacterium]|nr:DUF4236 domain-containing protein [Atopobiaceae bacterium]